MNSVMGFEIGDRVCLIVDHPGENRTLMTGSCGTIVQLDYDGAGVEWDQEIKEGHTCDGTAMDGHGWFVDQRNLRLIDEEQDYDMIMVSDEELAALLS